jgi:transketolase
MNGIVSAPPRDRAELCATMRRWIIERSFDANVGHIGSALSVVDIVGVLWADVLRNPATKDADRDRFILAKGHAALALYSAMHWLGHIDDAEFQTYCGNDSKLGVHPEHGLPGVEVTTGSLGQGLSVACGLAFALQARKSPARVFTLLSDAECNEGQVWEAAMFAGHHGLNNLVAVIDANGMQAMGETKRILDQSRLRQQWDSFGWQTLDVDGHDETALRTAFAPELGDGRSPRLVIARTVQGKGVSFMERNLEWHYRNLSADLSGQALAEIGGGA